MKTLSFRVDPLQPNGRFFRRRAIELYDANSPFRGRAERDRKIYNRKLKHKNSEKF